MTKESWYAGNSKDMIRLCDIYRLNEPDSFTVDYDTRRGMYRVSIFNDNHFKDEFWFDAYDKNDCVGCKHNGKDRNAVPCCDCSRADADYYEAK